jgi:glycogen debranching enzyme
MDTNYPACTPREGYPIEIQALWIRFLQHLNRIAPDSKEFPFADLASQASHNLQRLYWCPGRGYYADLIAAPGGQPARTGTLDDALRSNCIIAISLGLTPAEDSKRCLEAATQHLVIPGALRSLAPTSVSVPLPNRLHGRLLNDPGNPYWGRYEGDEDTRRKPAYHNGTGWTWTFPAFCESLARSWNFTPESLLTAKALLLSMEPMLTAGCLCHLPEVVDGDAPHTQRGCDAQAWSATEAFRVWKLLINRTAITDRGDS